MKRIVENREHKSDVFSMLMEYPEYALNVYNVLNGTNYKDSALVEIRTLEKGISLTIRNDAAFIIGADLNIYEHQSTYNPNMPLRSLVYFAEIIKSYIKDRDIYGRQQIKIPRPNFVVFYNGADKRPEVEEQLLSGLYDNDGQISLELKCIVYNINPDNNNSLKSESYVLNGYSIFVEKVKELITAEDELAVSHAIDYCIENDILRDFFETRKDEVRKNMTLDMTFEAREKIIRRDEFAAGKAEGKVDILCKLLRENVITIETAAEQIGMSVEDFRKIMSEKQ